MEETEEGDDVSWLQPPAAGGDQEMEPSGEDRGMRIEESIEQNAQALVEAQALRKKPARQRFAALPQWMSDGAGQLLAGLPEWNHQEGAWAVRLGATTLTKEQQAACMQTFKEITKKPFVLPGAAGPEARGSASSS
ncbi:unnamed protein product [Prorocentrum cordatum]|uniref:Uncharacterized protein n=1 Tax=Prorocentrum cordatum TaxID=2364126 RepID=A0ABN9UD86_9DINO|nr:unnamed protein product [Polarella glacialis]